MRVWPTSADVHDLHGNDRFKDFSNENSMEIYWFALMIRSISKIIMIMETNLMGSNYNVRPMNCVWSLIPHTPKTINFSIVSALRWITNDYCLPRLPFTGRTSTFVIIHVKSFQQTHQWFSLNEAVALRAHMNTAFFLSHLRSDKGKNIWKQIRDGNTKAKNHSHICSLSS